METATLKTINERLFHTHEAFISQPKVGKCRLVAIHNRDASTDKKYEGYNNDYILVSLKPLSGSGQRQIMLDNDTVFQIQKN